jgi:hypothetical protein
MKRIILNSLLVILMFASCKHGTDKKSMKGDEQVVVADFIAFFDKIDLPVTFKDSLLAKKPNDSAMISQTVFSQFISDTVFHNDFKGETPNIYAVGQFKNGKKETYLLFKGVHNKKQKLYVAVLNEKDSFKTCYPMLSLNGNPGKESLSIDNKFTFTNSSDTKGEDGTIYTVNKVLAYNMGAFMVILTDGLPAGVQLPIIDPIDTLPRKGKFGGNYTINKRNFVSIRDGSKPQQVRFFIHVEKDKNASGELKGEAMMLTSDSAIYKADGDPCGLSIKFNGSSLMVTESNCGNRHDMGCTFDGKFIKQKEITKPKEKKKAANK